MHTTDFFLQMLEFAASTDNIVEEVPDLSLEKIFAQTLPVGNLGLQNKLVVVVAKLDEKIGTFAMPELPHIPTDSKECFRGSSSTSLL